MCEGRRELSDNFMGCICSDTFDPKGIGEFALICHVHVSQTIERFSERNLKRNYQFEDRGHATSDHVWLLWFYVGSFRELTRQMKKGHIRKM